MTRLHRRLAAIAAAAACALAMSAPLSIFAAPAYAAENEARVLILNGLDPYLPAYLAVDGAMRASLADETTRRIVYFSESLDSQRFSIEALEPELVTLLSKKYSALHIDVVVAVSRPAIEFFKRHGEELWPGARAVYETFSAENVGPVALPPNTTDVVGYPNVAETIALAQRLQPNARRIVVVTGLSNVDQDAAQQARDALSMSLKQVAVEFYSGLPLQELLVRVAAEPADTIIIYLSEFRDRDGRPYTPREVLRAISKVSVAPVYGTAETYLGFGMAAGVMESYDDKGRLVAGQVRAALTGVPFDLGPSSLKPNRCMADARALRRWSLDERRLPDGCEIRFANRSVWRQYGWQIAAALTIIAGQTMLIVTLLTQRRRRRVAEAEVGKRLAEIAHMNRRVSMGELSASISHELKQPLTAIRFNVSAASILIRAEPPKLEEVAEILDDIQRDDRRASDIIDRIRSLLSKAEFEVRSTDLNAAIEQITMVLAGEASARGVSIKAELEPGLQKVSADSVQLQQVIVNLALNGMEAMHDLPAAKRILTIRSKRANDREAEVSVADSGAGIAEESIASIFDPFVTTKSGGMGMGLAISRTIIQAHRGQIRAENSPAGGAVFYFTLPFALD